MRILKQVKILIIGCVVFIGLFMASVLNAQDSEELEIKRFGILSPFVDETVNNTMEIVWEVETNRKVDAKYEVYLYSNSCTESSFYGKLSSGEFTSGRAPSQISYRVGLYEGLENGGSIESGDYCLSLLVSFPGESQIQYESHVEILIEASDNFAPEIENAFDNYLIKKGENFELPIEAVDPENSSLNYELIESPESFSINAEGLLTVNSESIDPGNYLIKVRVSDEQGASSEASFMINIVNEGVTLDPRGFSILYPTEYSVLSGLINRVQWSVSGVELSQIKVSIANSKDFIFNEFAVLSGNRTEANLIVNTYEDGAYYLRFVLTDKEGNSIGILSDKFLVLNNLDLTYKSTPLIFDLAPSEGESLATTPESISGKWSNITDTSSGSISIQAFLDRTEVSDKCNVLEQEFECVFEEGLSSGKHIFSLSLLEEGNIVSSKEWLFNIGSDDVVVDPTITPTDIGGGAGEKKIKFFGGEISQSVFIVGIVLILIGIVVLVVPWMMFIRWSKKKRDAFGSDTKKGGSSGPVDPYAAGNLQPIEPVSPTSTGAGSSTNKYQIGIQAIDDIPSVDYSIQSPTPAQSASNLSPLQEDLPEPSLPDTYTDEDIPDWLKDVGGSQPKGFEGENYEAPEPIQGTQPYGMGDDKPGY